MKYISLVICLFVAWPVWAQDRYVQDGKVVYSNPQEHDVLRVKASFGFCTVLEFPEKPILVTVGDNSLLQVEVPKNSKNVVIKPLENRGTTNLFVFTQNKRFNYEVVISDEKQVDYVVDTKESVKDSAKSKKSISVSGLIKMAQNYPALKELGVIDQRNFLQKDLFYLCNHELLTVNVIETFTYKNPHYLLLHIVVRNIGDRPIELNEKNTNVYIHDQKFIPRYVLFDTHKLKIMEKTDGWLILEDTFISTDNHFTFGIGIEDKEYVCH